MTRQPVTPSTERTKPQHTKTKADVLATQRDKARNLVKNTIPPTTDRRGPTL